MRLKFTSVIFLFIGFIFITSFLSCGNRDVDCLKVDGTTFQEEVIESNMPVLVVFCSDELWNREKAGYTSGLGYTQPSPVILALKDIIEGGQYNDIIKFCRYYKPSRSDVICTEYNIKWFPTMVIFKDGDVFWKDEGAGCFPEESREKLEGILQEAINE
jgi:hypothetical protein